MSQPQRPTFINLPQPPSNPETPSEMPGTPTSTTTSLSALSTTAIKDGHRGHALPDHTHGGNHQHTHSLEAERADRISRLAGLGNLTTLRPPHPGHHGGAGAQHPSSQPNPAVPGGFTPAAPFQSASQGTYHFDAAGQPVANTKMSTVGSASATESVGGRTIERDDVADEDTNMSVDTNYRDTEMDDASGYMASAGREVDMDDDGMATRSIGGDDDPMSDDGSASLVGFGEGAGSTVSGPISLRRPLPMGASAGNPAGFAAGGLERTNSGLSDGQSPIGGPPGSAAGGFRRDIVRPLAPVTSAGIGAGLPSGDTDQLSSGGTPVTAAAVRERQQARMVDGVTMDGRHTQAVPPGDDNAYVDTTSRPPVPIAQPGTTLPPLRETRQARRGGR